MYYSFCLICVTHSSDYVIEHNDTSGFLEEPFDDVMQPLPNRKVYELAFCVHVCVHIPTLLLIGVRLVHIDRLYKWNKHSRENAENMPEKCEHGGRELG